MVKFVYILAIIYKEKKYAISLQKNVGDLENTEKKLHRKK